MLRSLRATKALALSVAMTIPASVLPCSQGQPQAAALVVEVDECQCDSFLQFETQGGEWKPWRVNWTPEEGHQDGSCAAGGCEEVRTPRPCSGKFRIGVSFNPGPTAPCGPVAAVSYRQYGALAFTLAGELNPARAFVYIRNAGNALLICATVALGKEPFLEPDDTTSELFLSCATPDGILHSRLLRVREGCKPCAALPE